MRGLAFRSLEMEWPTMTRPCSSAAASRCTSSNGGACLMSAGLRAFQGLGSTLKSGDGQHPHQRVPAAGRRTSRQQRCSILTTRGQLAAQEAWQQPCGILQSCKCQQRTHGSRKHLMPEKRVLKSVTRSLGRANLSISTAPWLFTMHTLGWHANMAT